MNPKSAVQARTGLWEVVGMFALRINAEELLQRGGGLVHGDVKGVRPSLPEEVSYGGSIAPPSHCQ